MVGGGFWLKALRNSQIDDRHHLCLSRSRKEGSMIRPIIHRQLTRGDLACLVDEIARVDVAEGREAEYAAALALWWAGCFPEWVERGGSGSGMVRAYVTFAGRMLALASDLLESSAPEEAALCGRAADARSELHAALAEARSDYIGDAPHSAESRLNRFLKRLGEN